MRQVARGVSANTVKRTLEASLRHARRIVITVVGATVVAVGIAMIVLPGPAFIVIPAGLAILGLEFAWARRWLAVVREHAGIAADQVIMKSIALGWPDDTFPANAVVSERKAVAEATVFVGFGD